MHIPYVLIQSFLSSHQFLCKSVPLPLSLTLPFQDPHSHWKTFRHLPISKEWKTIPLGLNLQITLTVVAFEHPKMYTAVLRRKDVVH